MKTLRDFLYLIVLPIGCLWFFNCHASPEIEAAVQGYLAKMTPAEVARSNSYFEGGYWIQLWNFFLGLIMALVILKMGWAAKLQSRVRLWFKNRFLQDSAFIVIYLIFTSLLTFPFTVYTDFIREHQYGLANQNFAGWFTDYLRGAAIALVFGTLFVAIIYILIRRFAKTWWIWGTVASAVFMCFTLLIGPVFLEPIFNTYKPLAPGPVRDSILAMAHSNGIGAGEVYQFDASKQSNRVSANASGIFGTMRISLNDNLLKRCSLPEIRAVMGHEIGHYVMNHILKNLVFVNLLGLIGFALTYRFLNFTIGRYGKAWGIDGQGDIAGLPLLIALFSMFIFFLTPIGNTIARSQEVEADMFGLNLAGEPDGAAEAALKLSEYRKMSPSLIEEFIFFDHPSGENRIRMAMTWKFNTPARK